MTASKNTILALGLVLLALAAGKSAPGASSLGFSGSSSDASSSAGGNGANTLGNSNGVGACHAGCDAGCDCAGTADCGVGCEAKVPCAPDDPVFSSCARCFNDLCAICEGAQMKVEASILIVHRSPPENRTVLLDPTGANLFSMNQLGFPFEAGPRISLTALDCEGWGFEVNYFGIDGWSASADVPTGGNLVVDNSGVTVPLTDAHFESISRLYSTELNFRRPAFDAISVLVGFRWVDMTDEYSAGGTSDLGSTVSETIRTRNHMFGCQIGADGTLFQKSDRWRIAGFIKGGVFLDYSNQATTLNDPDNAVSPLAASNNDVSAAFFREMGLVGYVQICKHLSASAGYQVMIINGVAQPAKQLAVTNLNGTTPSATVDASSGPFYHGATAGLELTW